MIRICDSFAMSAEGRQDDDDILGFPSVSMLDHEFILNGEPLGTLMDAARCMDGVKFWHGVKQMEEVFEFRKIEPAVRESLEWAEASQLFDVKTKLGTERLAALQAWTTSALCYALGSVLRAPHRTRESIKPALPYARLLFDALHLLPERYIFKGATLYRAECGAMDTWDEKMKVGGVFSFFTPTSFSRDAAVLVNFKGRQGPRTVFEVQGASGWIMDDFNPNDEREVLLEPVCNFEVLNAEKFDADHRMVLMGEITAGLHHVVGHVRPGTELLSGSPVKEHEKDFYRVWQEQQQQREQPNTPAGALNLDFHPFTEEEWANKCKTLGLKWKETGSELPATGTEIKNELLAAALQEKVQFTKEEWDKFQVADLSSDSYIKAGNRYFKPAGKRVPTRDKERMMSLLGKGSFMSTYRKKTKGAPAGEEVCIYAVKAVYRDAMEDMGITEEDVRREARVLAQLRHRHIILYFGLEETEEEMGIVMELAEEGSLADFIKHCNGCRRPPASTSSKRQVLIMTTQISDAMEYMHSQGVVHRDIKPDNILLSHTGAGAIHIKVADFGVAVLLATVSGSAGLLSKLPGTHQYFAPERARGQSYGRMADMWAVGCVIIELLTRERLRDAIWDNGVEVSGRREQLIGHVEREDEGLGGIVRELLHLEKEFRLSALSLKSRVRAAAEANANKVTSFLQKLMSFQTQGETHGNCIADIVQGMLTHSEHAGVQEEACRALSSLDKEEPTSRGVCRAVLSAMVVHKESGGVQQEACRTLRMLTRNVANGEKIAADGGVEAILAAMKAHEGSPGVQEQACEALANLARSEVPWNKVADGYPYKWLYCASEHSISVRTLMKHFKEAGGVQERVQHAVRAHGATNDTRRWGAWILEMASAIEGEGEGERERKMEGGEGGAAGS